MSIGAPATPWAHARPLTAFLRALAALAVGLSSCSEPAASGGRSDAQLKLTPQLVNATVKRTTLELIHLETAHERFVTTPEHPFATRDAGWVRAADLRPGDLLISGRDGPIAVASIRSEVLAQPVAVFNFTVDRSHAYLVGNDQVLVHNVGCRPLHTVDDWTLEEQLRVARRELERMQLEEPDPQRIRMTSDRVNELDAEMNRRREAWRAQRDVRRRFREEAERRAREEAERRARAEEEARRAREEVIQRIVELRHALANNRREQQALRASQRAPAQQIAELTRQRAALLDQLAELRVRELQRGVLKDSGWMHGTKKELDPARLEELQREIARGGLSDPRLAEIERELARSEPITQEFLNAIWRAVSKADRRRDQEPTTSEADGRQGQQPTTAAADAPARPQSSYERLQQDLHEERVAVEVVLSALENEYAHIQRTQAGSSSGPTWQERLRAIQEEQVQVRARWRARLEERLDRARRQLEDMRRLERFRDEALEADLTREIALLERELQRAG